jgi:hypothetical protein
MIDLPDPAALDATNEVTAEDLPRFAPVRYEREQPAVEDVEAATVEALDAIDGLADLSPDARVAITAGSRGIHDMPAVVRTVVSELLDRGLDPFVLPAMGSHGGATAEGQVEALAALGFDEASMGCEVVSSMDVERVSSDGDGRPVYAARDALEADAVLLANRVKPHTDFSGDIESGLCKMAVIGLGKQRGAEATHKAALAGTFSEVIRERAGVLFEETPIVGGVALLENANERAAAIEGLDTGEILEREPELLERSRDLLGTLPVEELDLLVVDELGKEISGTGMDTNVIGRMLVDGEPEPEVPDYTRIHVRSVTEGSHGNAIGMGLADYTHRRLVEDLDLTDTYVNVITSGEPVRARIPVILPTDRLAFVAAYSACGVVDPADMRIARITNTLDLDRFWVSEPVAEELRGDPDAAVGTPEPLVFEDGDLV